MVRSSLVNEQVASGIKQHFRVGRGAIETALGAAVDTLSKADVQAFSIGERPRWSVGVASSSESSRSGTPVLEVLCRSDEDRREAEKLLKPQRGLGMEFVVTGEIECFAHIPGRRMRPVLPGDSISHHALKSGTLGCLVRGRGKHSRCLYALSNAHVLAAPQCMRGDHVLQPGPHFKGSHPDDTVGRLADPINLLLSGVDAAIARMLNPREAVPKIRQIGRVSKTIAAYRGGLEVHKFGDTTGYTKGILRSFHGPEVVYQVHGSSYAPLEVFRFTSKNPDVFAKKGDSGSLIVTANSNHPVALLCSGDQSGGVYGIPIASVLRMLNVRIVRTSAELRRCR